MSLRINHNLASVNGHRNMVKNDMMISRSLEKLSSGLKINRAADDAAGLIISEQMRAQIAGLNQAVDNTETAVAMVQTAEGALDEMNTLLSKARELAVHAANDGANDATQLDADQSELDNIVGSITRIANNTQFGTKKLLDGSLRQTSTLTGSNTAAGNNIASVTLSGLPVDRLTAGAYTVRLTQNWSAGSVVQGGVTNGGYSGGALTGSTNAAALTNATQLASDSYTFDLKDKDGVTVGTFSQAVTTASNNTLAKASFTGSLDFSGSGGQNLSAATDATVIATANLTASLVDSNGNTIASATGLVGATVGSVFTTLQTNTLAGANNLSAATFSMAAANLTTNLTTDTGGDSGAGYRVIFSQGTGSSISGATAAGTSSQTLASAMTNFDNDLVTDLGTVDGNFEISQTGAGFQMSILAAFASGADSNGYSVQITNARTLQSVSTTASVGGSDGTVVNAEAALIDSNGTTVATLSSYDDSDLSVIRNQELGITIDLQGNNAVAYAGALNTNINNGVGDVTLTFADDEEGAVFQIGANRDQTTSVAFADMRAASLGRSADDITDSQATLDSLRTGSYLTNGLAQEAISIIDKAIDDVTNQRGKLGAIQSSTLESNLSNLGATLENTTAAESVIRDVDFAEESAIFTKYSILVQASTAMLAQANQLPQNVLKLLG